jgi:hypothetical protein
MWTLSDSDKMYFFVSERNNTKEIMDSCDHSICGELRINVREIYIVSPCCFIQ